jgi:drug/metabolite transporter (DMT)-like permease
MTASTISSRAGADGSDHRAVARGLGFVLVAMVLLPGQDAVAKLVSDTLSPGLINWARFFLQTLLTVPFLLYFEGPRGFVPNRIWPNLVRGSLIATSSMLFFTAIRTMPLADALAIFFVEPFILTVLSAVIDKEHVGWRRGIAVAAGFLGVLIVVRPSYQVFGPVSLIPAAAGFVFAVYVIMNRRLSAHDSPLTMQFSAGAAAMVIMTVALAFGAAAGMATLTPSLLGTREAGFLLLMGLLGACGHMMFLQAARLAPSSLIAPMQYLEIVCAALLGLLMFGDFPDRWSWVGIAIIVTSGLSVFWRDDRAQGVRSPAKVID